MMYARISPPTGAAFVTRNINSTPKHTPYTKLYHLGCSLTLAPLLRNRSESYIGSSKKSWDHSSVMFPSCTVPT